MKEGDYSVIDAFLDTAILKTTNCKSKDNQWNQFELKITKPSLIVKRNKINKCIKLQNEPWSLNAQLFTSFPSNFLKNEQLQIEEEWGFSTQKLLTDYKGKKSVPKQVMKLQMAFVIDKNMGTMLADGGTWGDPNTPPENLPVDMPRPDPRLLDIREQTAISSVKHICKLCNQPEARVALHFFHECQHPLKVIQRNAYWESVNSHSKSLHDFLIELEPTLQLQIASGLVRLKSTTANDHIIKKASWELCNLCHDPGHCGGASSSPQV